MTKLETNTAKYGDDEVYESFADNNIFFPIAEKSLEPLKSLEMTPNQITYISTFFTFLSIYYLHKNEHVNASLSYLMGYIFDCIDGKYARKYKMGSQYGMVIDTVSDNISNLVLIIYLIYRMKINGTILLIIFMSFMLSISYGLNEAISSYKETKNDNFYERRKKELKNETGLIYKIFLYIIKTSYQTYRMLFSEYDEQKINKWLKTLKVFGPGNYCLMISIILLYIK